MPGCNCGRGKRPILGDTFEGAQGSLVDPVGRPQVRPSFLRDERTLPPWVFYREPPVEQLLSAEPEDDLFHLPPSPNPLSSRDTSPPPDFGLAPVQSQTDAADAAVEEGPVTEDEEVVPESVSCVCGRPDSAENMVACGTDPHPGEAHVGGVAWFHLSCAGLENLPRKGKHIRDPLTLVLC